VEVQNTKRGPPKLQNHIEQEATLAFPTAAGTVDATKGDGGFHRAMTTTKERATAP
jgi:hypothetical protein